MKVAASSLTYRDPNPFGAAPYNEANQRRAGNESAWYDGSRLHPIEPDMLPTRAQRPWDDGSNFRSYFPADLLPTPSGRESDEVRS